MLWCFTLEKNMESIKIKLLNTNCIVSSSLTYFLDLSQFSPVSFIIQYNPDFLNLPDGFSSLHEPSPTASG